MAVICITGGDGMIGKKLTGYLVGKGHQIIILSRKAIKSSAHNVSYKQWDIARKYIDPEAINNTEIIIHLAGANVAEKRWSKKRKEEILKSRTESGRLLAYTLQTMPNKVKTIISASAIGWYGPDQGKVFTEDMPVHSDFLGSTCEAWEASIHPAEALGIRLITTRIGIVLSNDGGALAEFKKPLRFGIAPILGNGRQKISWIHIDDLCRMMEFAITHTEVRGIYNATAPYPVSNRDLMLTLAKKTRRFYIPVYVPALILKIVLGEMSIEVLKSCTTSSEKIRKAGFQFLYPSIEAAFEELINS